MSRHQCWFPASKLYFPSPLNTWLVSKAWCFAYRPTPRLGWRCFNWNCWFISLTLRHIYYSSLVKESPAQFWISHLKLLHHTVRSYVWCTIDGHDNLCRFRWWRRALFPSATFSYLLVFIAKGRMEHGKFERLVRGLGCYIHSYLNVSFYEIK